jgi:hypothetical protein
MTGVDLLTMAYEATPPTTWRALPAKWDGREVEWGAFSTFAFQTTLRLHARSECCERCGTPAPPVMAQGSMYALPGQSVDVWARTRSGKPYLRTRTVDEGERVRMLGRLTASRCTRCGLDTVIDCDGDMWTLDESDYGPEGSNAQ